MVFAAMAYSIFYTQVVYTIFLKISIVFRKFFEKFYADLCIICTKNDSV